MGQASLTAWQGQQLHCLNKEHCVNLKWPQHNTASIALLIKANTWHVCQCCEIKQPKHSTVRQSVSGTRQTTKQQMNTMNFKLTISMSQLKKNLSAARPFYFPFKNLKLKQCFGKFLIFWMFNFVVCCHYLFTCLACINQFFCCCCCENPTGKQKKRKPIMLSYWSEKKNYQNKNINVLLK